ncbi:MAG: hypothetical protein V2A61_03030, partial [Calditrichota bacterium]
ALTSDPLNYIIGDEIGGSITIQAPFAPEVQAVYETMSPRPLVENFALPEAGDITHLVNHSPHFTWNYFEVVERVQTHYQIKVYPQQSFDSRKPLWDSGEVASGAWEAIYRGPELADGESYAAELRVFSGYLWSDPPVFFNFRLNSLPSTPEPNAPQTNELTSTRKPELVSLISQDREGDGLKYSFDLFRSDQPQQPAQSISRIAAQGGFSRWIPTEELAENNSYRFRVKAEDPYESSPWSDFRVFYVNALEEPPAAFSLEYPIGGATIYPLHPTLRWKEAIDPDPLSQVTYTVDIAKTPDFKAGRQYVSLASTNFYVPDSLDNRSDYYWRVTAVDNTGRTKLSNEVGQFQVDTTPSTPLASAPLTGEERKPEAELSWEPAADPDPNDILTYEIEVFPTPQALKKLASKTAWSQTRIAVQNLEGSESLQDNIVFYWRVRTWDNHRATSGFSAMGSFFFNRYNDLPLPVTSISQPPDSVKGTTKVTFTWKAVSDPDLSDPPSSLVYDIEAVVGSFESGAVRKFSSLSGVTSLTADLDDNQLWQYRLRSRDDEGAVSDWSPQRKTRVNVQEDPPTPFDLSSPAERASIVELDSLDFQWQPSSDIDWESSIHYRFELVHGSDRFTAPTKVSNYTFRGGLKNETAYTWRVVAIDNTGLETVCRKGFSFTASTTPTVPGAIEMAVELKPEGQLKFAASSDPNPLDTLKYVLQIARDSTFAQTQIKLDITPLVPGAVNLTIGALTGQNALEDDNDYFFQVKARDNHGYESSFSRPVKFRFNRQNDAPTSPAAPFKPALNEVVRELQPTLIWSPSSDEDLSDPPASLVYDLRLGWEVGLDKASRLEFTSPPGAVSLHLPQALDDNRPWFWQVRARDDDGAVSAWSPVQSFMVNQQEDPPTAPQLSNPSEEQRFNILGPITLCWNAALDPDWKSSVKYRVEYSINFGLTQPQHIGPVDSLSVQLLGPLDNTTYYWHVTAIDNTGLETASRTMSFVLDTRPTIPQPKTPVGHAELTPEGILEWSPSTDPNPADKITYALEISTGGVGGEILFQKSDLTATTLTVKESGWKGQDAIARLGDNIVCRWRIMAADNHNIASNWSEPAEFILNWRNDPPSAFNLIAPTRGDTIIGKPVAFRWSKANDPDPNDKVSYTLVVARDREFKQEISRQTGLSANEVILPVETFPEAGIYYWKVIAGDLHQGKVAGSNSEAEPWGVVVKATSKTSGETTPEGNR